MMNGQELGEKGERFIFSLFEQAERQPIFAGPGDIRLDDGQGLAIEVKAARPTRAKGRGQRYHFSLYRAARGRVKTDASRSDLLVLLAYPLKGDGEPVTFAIPAARVGRRRHITLPVNLSAYRGRWSWFVGWERALVELGG